MNYYQVGGFLPHIHWTYQEKELAELVAGDASPLRRLREDPVHRTLQYVELILGIKRTGTSHLLLTENQAFQIAHIAGRPNPKGPGFRAADFESLSPIRFDNTEQLTNKLRKLRPKPGKKTSNRVDNSQCNKQYETGTEGVARSAYEHARLIHEVAQRRIDLKTYALGENSWMPSARVLSFVFTPRGMDTRPSNQRRSDPLALDFGLAQATLPDCKLQIGSALHFASTDDKYLMAGGSQKLAFEWGTTEEMDIIKISTRLKTFFAERIRESAGPIILLVHGKELSMTMLKNKGVDTSRWVSGIKDLLGFPQIERSPRRGQQQYPRHEQSNGYRRGSDSRGSYYDDRRGRPRSRSRSPSRASSSYGGPPRRSPPRHPGTSSQDQPRGALAPVYVVDVQQLYETSMQTQSSSKSVSQMAKYVGISKSEGWCAGNEAVMIIDLWRSMISGLAIDEQRELVKLRNNPQGQAQATSEANDEEGGSDSDSDFDPNSIIQEAPAPTRKSYIDEGESDDGRSSGSDD